MSKLFNSCCAVIATICLSGVSALAVWIRDLNTFIEVSLQVNPPERLREALLPFFKFQGANGDIVDGYIPLDQAKVKYAYRTSALAPNLRAHKNTVETDQQSSLVQMVANVRAAGAAPIGLTPYPPYPEGSFRNPDTHPSGQRPDPYQGKGATRLSPWVTGHQRPFRALKARPIGQCVGTIGMRKIQSTEPPATCHLPQGIAPRLLAIGYWRLILVPLSGIRPNPPAALPPPPPRSLICNSQFSIPPSAPTEI